MECLMDHIVLNLEDGEKMIAFYSKVLMFAPERLEEYNAGDVPFPSVRLNSNTIIDLFPKKMWQESARAEQGGENLNHFCIALSKGTLSLSSILCQLLVFGLRIFYPKKGME